MAAIVARRQHPPLRLTRRWSLASWSEFLQNAPILRRSTGHAVPGETITVNGTEVLGTQQLRESLAEGMRSPAVLPNAEDSEDSDGYYFSDSDCPISASPSSVAAAAEGGEARGGGGTRGAAAAIGGAAVPEWSELETAVQALMGMEGDGMEECEDGWDATESARLVQMESVLEEQRRLMRRMMRHNGNLRYLWRKYAASPLEDRGSQGAEGVVTLGETSVLTEFQISNDILRKRVQDLEGQLREQTERYEGCFPSASPAPPPVAPLTRRQPPASAYAFRGSASQQVGNGNGNVVIAAGHQSVGGSSSSGTSVYMNSHHASENGAFALVQTAREWPSSHSAAAGHGGGGGGGGPATTNAAAPSAAAAVATTAAAAADAAATTTNDLEEGPSVDVGDESVVVSSPPSAAASSSPSQTGNYLHSPESAHAAAAAAAETTADASCSAPAAVAPSYAKAGRSVDGGSSAAPSPSSTPSPLSAAAEEGGMSGPVPASRAAADKKAEGETTTARPPKVEQVKNAPPTPAASAKRGQGPSTEPESEETPPRAATAAGGNGGAGDGKGGVVEPGKVAAAASAECAIDEDEDDGDGGVLL